MNPITNDWFSSDWHLGHNNILKYDKRPFYSIEQHDAAIVLQAVSMIQKGDNFYYLGDLSLGKIKNAEVALYELMSKGINMFFIKGNHDNKETVKLYEKYGTFLGTLAEVKVQGQRIVLCHYGMRVWNKCHHGNWHLYGHSHGSLPAYNKSFDVGINLWNYQPISFQKVKEKMDTLTFQPVDHHE